MSTLHSDMTKTSLIARQIHEAVKRRPHAKHIHGDPADEIVRRKPMGGSQQAGVRTARTTPLGSSVKLWNPAIT
jgi:hypothetical protein